MPVSLDKRIETAKVSLTKQMQISLDKGIDPGEVSAQVVLVFDYSGSMRSRFERGEVQDLADRTLALSLTGLDDDGNIQVVPFDHGVHEPFTVDASNHTGAIDRWRTISPAQPAQPGKGLFRSGRPGQPAVYRQMGGTDYIPAIRRVVAMIGNELRSDIPTFVLFVTDGAPSEASKAPTQQLLIDLSDQPFFWQFLGLGYSPQFLSQLDKMGGRKVDNVGLFDVNDSQQLPDDRFFDQVLSEFVQSWLPAARREGIIP